MMSFSVTVVVPLEPCVTLKLFGEADSEKSGCAAALTVRLTVVECVRLPLVPVIVSSGPFKNFVNHVQQSMQH